MALEIERKYLLSSDAWRILVIRSIPIRQGYLSNNPAASVRVRIAGDQANLNIKGMTIGIERLEYEYPISVKDATELLDKLCTRPQIEKVRHIVESHDKQWEIDEFFGDNAGLTVAEVELTSAGEAIQLPVWIGREVSHEVRYYNASLGQYPYSAWKPAEKQV